MLFELKGQDNCFVTWRTGFVMLLVCGTVYLCSRSGKSYESLVDYLLSCASGSFLIKTILLFAQLSGATPSSLILVNTVAKVWCRKGIFNIYSYTIPSYPGAEFLSLLARVALMSFGVYGEVSYSIVGLSIFGNQHNLFRSISSAFSYCVL